jgi:polyhydroxyalkanoate synthase subunit PhaC
VAAKTDGVDLGGVDAGGVDPGGVDPGGMDLESLAPTLDEMQHWTGVIGRAQQIMLEYAVQQAMKPMAPPLADFGWLFNAAPPTFSVDPAALVDAQRDFWRESLDLWQRFLDPQPAEARAASEEKDRRFAAPAWRDHPLFDLIRQSYRLVADHMLRSVDMVEGLSGKQRDQLRFAMGTVTDALSPSNFALTNPQALQKIVETRGESLIKGMQNMLADLDRGQLTHSNRAAFTLGKEIAATPGKVIHETPLYQLIQYTPTTPEVAKIPLVIFPPWINRFYILDLNPQKSFVRWAVEQGLTVFMVSWKSADESMAGIILDDYVEAQIAAVDVAREVCAAEAAHVIGYCVAGTTLAATLALLAARGEAEKVRSATFFTAQVDFADAGDLGLFVDDAQLDLAANLAGDKGFLDGRYLAATFNLLRGRDLIWNYVVQNYLLGEEHVAFDLLHWNGDVTNLPAAWHQAYLRDLYRDNLLVTPGAIRIADTPIDLGKVRTPAYIQAGREDHIAPPQSVWKLTRHLRGPLEFVLAGSGHIAGVVNPPAAGKYQFWSSETPADTLAGFLAQATETKGSWWPHWRAWIARYDGETVPAKKARQPGQGARKAIEDAPGRYVVQR